MLLDRWMLSKSSRQEQVGEFKLLYMTANNCRPKSCRWQHIAVNNLLLLVGDGV